MTHLPYISIFWFVLENSVFHLLSYVSYIVLTRDVRVIKNILILSSSLVVFAISLSPVTLLYVVLVFYHVLSSLLSQSSRLPLIDTVYDDYSFYTCLLNGDL